jgi:D-glycero-D-manno-heptose 1,7-bisphosphate phosphatase
MKKVSVVFLDRDGVINEYPGNFRYVTGISEFKLLPRAREALLKLTEFGCRLFIISNQAGVSKGLYSRDDLDAMTEYMKKELGPGIAFDGIYYCTHTSEENCACRKPKTFFIDKAREKLRKEGFYPNPDRSFFVGDSLIDVETGKAGGLKTIMVFSGRECPENSPEWKVNPDLCCKDLFDAAQIITAP